MTISFFVIVVSIAFIWGVTYTRIQNEREQVLLNTFRDNTHIVAVVQSNLEQVIGKLLIYADLATELLDGERTVGVHLNPAMNGDRAFLRLAIFNGKNDLVFSSSHRSIEPDFSNLIKKTLAAERVEDRQKKIVIGRPQSSLDAWRIPMLMAVPHRSGDGYLGTMLDLGYFLRAFENVDLGVGGRIEIIGSDGFQLVELSGGTFSAAREYRGADYLSFLNAEPKGHGLVIRDGDKARSIVAFSQLENYPLTVVVSQDYEEALINFNARRVSYLWWASGISIFLIACTFVIALLLRRQRSIHLALTQSENKNLKLIRQLEEEKGRAYKLASHDQLTGLPNRMLFSELATSHILRARRSRRYHAVLFIDLDRFKMINDTLGHSVGDLLLKEVANRFKDNLRDTDVVSRFGGDEFVMLVNDVESVEGIALVAEKLVAAISAPFCNLDGHTVEVSPSIGIALCPQDGEDIEVLIKHSDAAMYIAKAAGRGTYRFHDLALNKIKLLQMELIQGFRRGIRENEFILHYQPRVETDDFSLVGVEALIRWQHPEHGLIFPNDFVALAEENDLIGPLGYWVINEACRQLDDWRSRELPLTPVAINVSAKQFRDERFVDEVIAIMQRHDIPASLLEIEVTESCLMAGCDRVSGMLERLVKLGLRIAIDDYGTGFASIGYLKSLPLDAIKIDRTFIREIHNDSSDEMIVSSTITLAHNLGLKVVAEGVETRDQLVHLKTIGCDQLQGYYFSRPVSADDIEQFLRDGRVDR